MINELDSFLCPNCLTSFPVTTELMLALGEMESIYNKYKPTVCPMCGTGMLVDDEYRAYTTHKEVPMMVKTYVSLMAMKEYAKQANLSKYKQPWNN